MSVPYSSSEVEAAAKAKEAAALASSTTSSFSSSSSSARDSAVQETTTKATNASTHQVIATASGSNAAALGSASMSVSGSPGTTMIGVVASLTQHIYPVSSSSITTATTDSAKEVKSEDIGKALREFYGSKKIIDKKSSIDGKAFPLLQVQLSIVEERNYKIDATKNEKDNKYQEIWYKNKVTIPPEKLFELTAEESNQHKRPVKKIRVVGPAGIGKTTFTQYVAYQWATNRLWNDRFKYLFWLKLRNLIKYADDTVSAARDVIFAECFLPQTRNAEATNALKKDIEDILIRQQNERDQPECLLVLDGYDEIVGLLNSKPVVQRIFAELMACPYVVLTSRPYYLNRLCGFEFDRKLENCGFNSEQITKYIMNYFSEQKEQKAISDWVQSQDMVMGLAQIPVTLNILCALYARNRLDLSNIKGEEPILVYLYKEMLSYLITEHYLNPHKIDTTNLSSFSDIEKTYAAELEYLGRVAYKGLQNQGQAIIEPKIFDAVDKEFHSKTTTGTNNRIFEMGLLRPVDYSDVADRYKPNEFLHFSLQEFLAARLLVEQFKSDKQNEVDTAKQFFITEKYNSKYHMIFNFIAGLVHSDKGKIISTTSGKVVKQTDTKGTTILTAFWNALQSEPLDLTGIWHMNLIIRCLDACYLDSNIPNLNQLVADIQKMLIFELENSNLNLGNFPEFNSSFILNLSSSTKFFINTVCEQIFIDALAREKASVRRSALYAIKEIGTKVQTIKILHAVALQLSNSDSNYYLKGIAKEILEMANVQLTSHLFEMSSAATREIDGTGDLRRQGEEQKSQSIRNTEILSAVLAREFVPPRLGFKMQEMQQQSLLRFVVDSTVSEAIEMTTRTQDAEQISSNISPIAIASNTQENIQKRQIADNKIISKGMEIVVGTEDLGSDSEDKIKEMINSKRKTFFRSPSEEMTVQMSSLLIKALEAAKEGHRQVAFDLLAKLDKKAATPTMLQWIEEKLGVKKYEKITALRVLGIFGINAITPKILDGLASALLSDESYESPYCDYAFFGEANKEPVCDVADGVLEKIKQKMTYLRATFFTLCDWQDKEVILQKWIIKILQTGDINLKVAALKIIESTGGIGIIKENILELLVSDFALIARCYQEWKCYGIRLFILSVSISDLLNKYCNESSKVSLATIVNLILLQGKAITVTEVDMQTAIEARDLLNEVNTITKSTNDIDTKIVSSSFTPLLSINNLHSLSPEPTTVTAFKVYGCGDPKIIPLLNGNEALRKQLIVTVIRSFELVLYKHCIPVVHELSGVVSKAKLFWDEKSEATLAANDPHCLCIPHRYLPDEAVRIRLNPNHQDYKTDRAAVLGKALAECKESVLYLDLSGNNLSDWSREKESERHDIFQISEELLKKHRNLHTLVLSRNEITLDGLTELMKVIISEKLPLRYLYLDHNLIAFDDVYCKELEKLLDQTNLQFLDLSMNFIFKGKMITERYNNKEQRIMYDRQEHEKKLAKTIFQTNQGLNAEELINRAKQERLYCKLFFRDSPVARSIYAKSPSVQSIVAKQHDINNESATVVLFANNVEITGFGEHAYLAIERVHKYGQRSIIVAELFANKGGSSGLSAQTNVGQIKISVRYYAPVEFFERVAAAGEIGTALINKKQQIKQLIGQILNFRNAEGFPEYKPRPEKEEKGAFNCYTWAKSMLRSIGIELSDSTNIPSRAQKKDDAPCCTLM